MGESSAQEHRTVEVFIEIPRGSRNKYEYDKKRGVFRLDRVLYSSVHFPTDYGFIPDTLAEDGDPLDALVFVEEPTFPGCLVEVRPVGMLDMEDERGPDEKILAVPVGDPRFAAIHNLSDLAPHWRQEIAAFFAMYKRLESKHVDLRGWRGVDVAWEAITAARARARRQQAA
ncbi:MAG: inorganic diphosphatase [Chloroflexi bacterium]|nr:inorganic diphosphatase [Chloroflexota bacterium]